MKTTRTPGSGYRALVAVHGDVSTVATTEGRFACVPHSGLRVLGWEPSLLSPAERVDALVFAGSGLLKRPTRMGS